MPARVIQLFERAVAPMQPALSLLRRQGARLHHQVGRLRPWLAMTATAAGLGLLVTLLGLPSGSSLAIVLVGLTLLAGGVALLYAGVHGRGWALSLCFLLLVFTIDATARRRGDMTESGMDAQTLCKLMLWGGAFLIGTVHFSRLKRALQESPPLACLCAFAVWSLLSTVYSITPTYTFGGGFGYLALLCFIAVTMQQVGIRRLTLPAIYACGLLTSSAVILYFIVPSMVVALLEGGTTPRLAGLTGSPNNLGRTAAIALFFIFFAVRDRQVRLWRPDMVLITLFSLAALFLSWSRTALAGVVVALVLVYLRRRITLAVWGAVALCGTLLVLTMCNVDWDRLLLMVSRHGSLSELTTLTGRTAIWNYVWDAFLKQPLIGYGYGSTKLLIPGGFRTVFGWTTTSAHNMFLQALVTTGAVGGVLILATVLLQLRNFFRRPHDLADAALLFVLISGFSEAGAVGVAPNLLTILWLISLAIPRPAPEQANTASHCVKRYHHDSFVIPPVPVLPSVPQGAAMNRFYPYGKGIAMTWALAGSLVLLLSSVAPAAAQPTPAGVGVPRENTAAATRQPIDLERIFSERIPVSGKFGWSNVSLLKEEGKTVVRVRYPAGSYDPGSMKLRGLPVGGTGFRMRLPLPPADCATLSYRVRFPAGFPFVKGGKLPGLGGGKGNSGGKIPDGSDGFSTRFMWRNNGAGEVYAYLPTSKVWGTSLGRGEWYLTPGAWNLVEQTVRLNTPGNPDGEIAVRLNGKPVHASQGLRFRDTGRLSLDLLIFETFFGGNAPDWAPPADTYADFADMGVSTCN